MYLVSNPFNRRKLRFSDPAVNGVYWRYSSVLPAYSSESGFHRRNSDLMGRRRMKTNGDEKETRLAETTAPHTWTRCPSLRCWRSSRCARRWTRKSSRKANRPDSSTSSSAPSPASLPACRTQADLHTSAYGEAPLTSSRASPFRVHLSPSCNNSYM